LSGLLLCVAFLWLYFVYPQITGSISFAGSLPSARWIVNFDLDFMDGLVLAAVLAAHCPFLVSLLYYCVFYLVLIDSTENYISENCVYR
jgi:hypothetical protein